MPITTNSSMSTPPNGPAPTAGMPWVTNGHAPCHGREPIKRAAQLETWLRVCAPHCKKGHSEQRPPSGRPK
uniref:Uncharacterized protein n=1 Tax=Amphimedon queenslandica TaxID=400682 RepID=A0A1X7V3B0_AMPQE